MSLDEYIYEVVAGFLKKRKRRKELEAENTVSLEEVKSKLLLLSRAVTGAQIRIFPAEMEGGYKNTAFFLPEYVNLFPTAKDNFDFYLFRTLFLSYQYLNEYNYPAGDPMEYGIEEARHRAMQCADDVINVMEEDFPRMGEKHRYFLKMLPKDKDGTPLTYWLYGKWMKNDKEQTGTAHVDTSVKTKKQQERIQTIMKAKASEEMKSLQVDKKQQEDMVLHNYYEKIETVEEFGGGTWRDFDGSDELEEHADALEEIRMNNTVRVDDPVHSVYQAEFMENVQVGEVEEQESAEPYVEYDEWDYNKKTYKERYCKVFTEEHPGTDASYYYDTIRENATTLTGLRKMLTHVNNKFHRLRRQPKGDEFDLDAVIDRYVTLRAGHTPAENIYLDKRKKEKELSILFLLDISLSSDSYAAGNRVIDVEKQVSILFGEILDEFGVDFSIGCFYSKTRNNTRYIDLKPFDEDWKKARLKIGSPQPLGYTRIGAALRHAGALISRRDSKNKWVILISDGKPNDYDKYEGTYGIQDIKQALRELNAMNINTYALAIEAQAKYYLPVMFGARHFEILTTPRELLMSLAGLYERIRYKT